MFRVLLIKGLALIYISCAFNFLHAHGKPKVVKSERFTSSINRKIQFPNTERYKTLVLDPHTHSSFSDGHVWPRIRVEEALRDGLDALAITEHLEHLPHYIDLPFEDRNRAYQAALESNQDLALLVIPGAEITRDAPDNHYNALFINDANKLRSVPNKMVDITPKEQLMPLQDVFDEAKRQDAFMILNHAWWAYKTLSRSPAPTAFHILNAKNNKLQGMEIANKHSYSAEAFQTAIDLNLTLMGGSDIHELIDWEFHIADGGHRTVTLVLADKKTPESIHQALLDGRTIVWFKNQLMGLSKNLAPLLKASITVKSAEYRNQQQVLFVEIENHSDAEFQLRNLSQYAFYYNSSLIKLPPNSTSTLAVRTVKRASDISLKFEVLNTYVAPNQHAQITLTPSSIDLIK